VKTTCVAVPAIKATAVLVAVESVLVVSVATNWQLLPVLIATAENVAASFMAVTDVVPVSAHTDVRTMTSVALTPPWRATPLLASTDTTKVGSTVPAATVVGGSVVKPSSVGVFDTNEIALLVTVKPLSGERVSVAMSVQLVPAEKATSLLKVATPAPFAVAVTGVPVSVHPLVVDVMATVSLAPVPVVMTLP
jgi:hypothetical protein